MERNISTVKEKNCCGCAACSKCCPHNAITMKEDVYGFVYPELDKEKCVNCGMCLNVCPSIKIRVNQIEKGAYAARSNRSEVLKQSASGGLCHEIATWMLEQGGIVFGAYLDAQLCVKHIAVEEKKDLHKLQGSKYVQSNCEESYQQVKYFLGRDKKVLFIGTPCQVSAIKNYVGNNPNLYTVDIICHGVPNQRMFLDYIKLLGEKQKGKVVGFSFRDKQKGWGTVGNALIETAKKVKNIPIYKTEQSYYYYYLQGFLSRKSCYECYYAQSNRVGDITLGDYWGIENVHPKLKNVHKGISLMLCNTTKGIEVSRALKNVELITTNVEQASKYNNQLTEAQTYDKKREQLLELYRKKGYKAVDDYFEQHIGVRRYTDRIKQFVPRGWKKLLKNIKCEFASVWKG